MNELQKLNEKYLNKETNVSVYYKIDDKFLNEVFINARQYEKPDIIAELDDKIIGIEHFEFDAYANNKKGSDYYIQDKELKKQYNEMCSKDPESDFLQFHGSYEREGNLNNYYNNFIKMFNSHYNKIDSYIEEIAREKNVSKDKVEIWFFIEDITPLGSYFVNNSGGLTSMLPLYSTDVVRTLKSSKKLKCILFGQNFNKEKILKLINNDIKTLNKFESEKEEVTNQNFFVYKLQVIAQRTKIASYKAGEQNE